MVGRLEKAEQFYDAAETIRAFADDESDVGDAYVTLCVHAGIAAADAICCQALGQYARGDNHQEAIQLIKRVRPDGEDLGNALDSLLGVKTRAGYSPESVNAQMRRRTKRAVERLLRSARDRASGGR